MKRVAPVQLILIMSSVLSALLLYSAQLGAQSEPGASTDPDLQSNIAQQRIVVIIDNSRSVAVFGTNERGPINDLTDFTRFLVNYLKVFDPDIYIGVGIFGNESAEVKLPSKLASDWSEEEIEQIEPIPCRSGGYAESDPCSGTRMKSALEWAKLELEECSQNPSDVYACSVLIFTDGKYDDSIQSGESSEQVIEALDQISDTQQIRVIPGAVGNYRLNGFDGPVTAIWARPESQTYVTPAFEMNQYFESDIDQLGKLYERLLRAVVNVPANVRIVEVKSNPIPPLAPLWSPDVAKTEFLVAYWPSAILFPPPGSTNTNYGVYGWSEQDPGRPRLEGTGLYAFRYDQERAQPEFHLDLTPSEPSAGERVTLTLTLSGVTGTFDDNWFDIVNAVIRDPSDQEVTTYLLAYDRQLGAWTATFRAPSLPGDYSVTLLLEEIRNGWESPYINIPIQTTFFIKPSTWEYAINLDVEQVIAGGPFTLTIITYRDGIIEALPEDAKVEIVYEPQSEHTSTGKLRTHQQLDSGQVTQLADGVVVELDLRENTYLVSASIVLLDGTVVKGESVSLDVVPVPTATPADTPTPSATTTPEATNTPTPTPSPTSTNTLVATITAPPRKEVPVPVTATMMPIASATDPDPNGETSSGRDASETLVSKLWNFVRPVLSPHILVSILGIVILLLLVALGLTKFSEQQYKNFVNPTPYSEADEDDRSNEEDDIDSRNKVNQEDPPLICVKL